MYIFTGSYKGTNLKPREVGYFRMTAKNGNPSCPTHKHTIFANRQEIKDRKQDRKRKVRAAFPMKYHIHIKFITLFPRFCRCRAAGYFGFESFFVFHFFHFSFSCRTVTAMVASSKDEKCFLDVNIFFRR